MSVQEAVREAGALRQQVRVASLFHSRRSKSWASLIGTPKLDFVLERKPLFDEDRLKVEDWALLPGARA